jgi:hypothetical protein
MTRLHPVDFEAASIKLTDSVAKNINQEAAGCGGGAVVAENAVVGCINQKVTSPGSPERDHTGIEAVRELAHIEVKDGVVKEINQTVNVIVGDAESVEAILGHKAARLLKARLVFVACGRQIRAYHAEPHHFSDKPAAVYSLPDSMGSARSVRLATIDDRLFILAGARRGVVLFDQISAEAQVYPLPRTSEHGANAVTVHDRCVYATHSDFGLLRWPLGGGEASSLFPEVFGKAKTVRAVQADTHGNLLLCADATAYRIETACNQPRLLRYPTDNPSPLVGVVECGNQVYAASEDGRIYHWQKSLPNTHGTRFVQLPNKTYGLSLVQRSDGPHLVLPAKYHCISLVRLTPPRATIQYHTPAGTTLRFGRAASDLVVATDANCLALHYWNALAPDHPNHCITVAATKREAMMDLCVLSQ